MNYLLDRKNKRKKYWWVGGVLAVLVFIYFGSPIFRGLSFGSHSLFKPILSVGNKIGGKFSGLGSYFSSKTFLSEENERLKTELESTKGELASHDILVNENEELKEILNRKKEGANLVLAAILTKPNQSPYDTLLIDAGNNHGLKVGQRVLAYGNVPIGRVAEVNNTFDSLFLIPVRNKDVNFIPCLNLSFSQFSYYLPHSTYCRIEFRAYMSYFHKKIIRR